MATFLARTTTIRNKLHVFMSFTFNYIRCSDNVLLFLQFCKKEKKSPRIAIWWDVQFGHYDAY